MKFLVLGGILFVYYRFFFNKTALNQAEQDPKIRPAEEDNGDYVEYEEVE